MSRLFLFALSLSRFFGEVTLTNAQSFPLWGNLQSGAYAVGYRAAVVPDHSRVFIPERDYEGKLYAGERARPPS